MLLRCNSFISALQENSGIPELRVDITKGDRSIDLNRFFTGASVQ